MVIFPGGLVLSSVVVVVLMAVVLLLALVVVVVPTRLAALAGELSSSREGASLSVYHLPNITCNLFPPNTVILIGAIKEGKGCYRYDNEIRGDED